MLLCGRWPTKLVALRQTMRRKCHQGGGDAGSGGRQDRKSTRLNSSHLGISYAVFCLKKKNDKNSTPRNVGPLKLQVPSSVPILECRCSSLQAVTKRMHKLWIELATML